MEATLVTAMVAAHDPVVQDVLTETDRMPDLEDGIDFTLETVVKLREERNKSDRALWITQNKKNGFFHTINSRGLTRPRAPYTYHRYNLKEQFYDPKKMLIEALWAGIPPLRSDSDTSNIGARPNFGTITVPSIFDGIEFGVFTDIMPWISKHSSKEEVRRFADRYDAAKLPERGILPYALEQTRYFLHKLQDLDIGIGDINNQGPFDIAHQVRGDAFFYDLYDDAPFVHELMELCTQAYLDVYYLAEETAGRTGRTDMPYCDDSSVLVAEPQFLEFSLPYLYKLGEHNRGISVHYCGKGHLDQHYFDCPQVASVNLGQPEFFDYQSYMERVIGAGKVYAGGWPILPDEKSAEEYFFRILSPLQEGLKSIRFSINGYEFGKSSAELVRLWYELQGAPQYR